ncbi:MAG: FliI/YscN family ATPase, partial [Selenomonas sp.]|nr:FliI/YscN family ATPase [Selenomonas sp.]
KMLNVKVGEELLGRVLDGLGNPIDGKGPILCKKEYSLQADPPHPLSRPRIHESLYVGVRAIDGLITMGEGQRIGIMAGSGVGKSTLLSMIARNTEADISVIALIGERGREVRDFIERDLGEEGMKRSVVVVATSDQPALVRIKGAMTATAIAEYFRDQGRKVILMMDSVTRFAMAQREVGLTIGEPPATRGYTPSVFAMLPRLLERAGTNATGSITGIYTVLVDGDDMNEPIADAVRSILDGHIVLSRAIAAQNHFPAIDIMPSVSRVMNEVVSPEHLKAAQQMRQLMAVYRDAEDLIHIGAYVKGSSAKIDESIQKIDSINDFLCQGIYEVDSYEDTEAKLIKISG